MNQLFDTPDVHVDDVIKMAIMAVGGQGGGVLTSWIETCARAANYHVQATSVAGVAQRTGATIYYIEMAPASARDPVFSLMPSGGDVDILIAAEMMEAGRAIMRGFVTPDRTTLIASTHRALAVSEKTVPGDGMADPREVKSAAEIAAKRLISFDMEQIAQDCGSVISASLFGALAAADVLPFTRDQFEQAIRQSGRGVEASLAAFDQAFQRIADPAPMADSPPLEAEKAHAGPQAARAAYDALEQQIETLPEPARDMARAGLRAVIDFQDLAYGREYLAQLSVMAARDNPEKEFAFTAAGAKYLARAMVYDDVVRVADLKTRKSRFERIRKEMAPPATARLHLTEFMHPRAEELVGLLPAWLGRWTQRKPRLMRLIDFIFNRGRRVRTDRLLPFMQLYVLAGLRRWRRGMLRHHNEREHWQAWQARALEMIDKDYDLSVELILNRRLIKGYSDTHSRGLSKFDQVNEGAALVAGRADGADWARRLREAALADEQGEALTGALKTVKSFANT